MCAGVANDCPTNRARDADGPYRPLYTNGYFNYVYYDEITTGFGYLFNGYPTSSPYDGSTQYLRYDILRGINNLTLESDGFFCEGDSGSGMHHDITLLVGIAVAILEPFPWNPNCGTTLLKRFTPTSVSNIRTKQDSHPAPPERAQLVQFHRDDLIPVEELIKLPTSCIPNQDIDVTFHAINVGDIDTGIITTSYYYSSTDPQVLENRQFITSRTFASLRRGNMYSGFTATIPCPDTLGEVYVAAVPFPTAEEYSIDLDLRTIPLGSLRVDCAADCPFMYIDDGVCDSACLTEVCNYDGDDCCGNGTVDPGEDCESDSCCDDNCQFASSSVLCDDGLGLCNGQGQCEQVKKAEIKAVNVNKIKKTKVQVKWSLQGDEPVDEFHLEYRKKMGGWQSWEEVSDNIDGGSNKMTVKGLEKGRKYQVRVRSKNVAGKSGWKTSKVFQTKE